MKFTFYLFLLIIFFLKTDIAQAQEKTASYATQLHQKADSYLKMDDYASAEPLYKEALKIRKELLGEKHLDYANTLNNLTTLYDKAGKYTLAEPLYKEVLQLIKELLGYKHPAYLAKLHALATMYIKMDKYDLAEPLFKETVQIDKEVLGDKHPDYAISVYNMGLFYDQMGKYASAEPLYKEVLQILDKKHPQYLSSVSNLALVYQEMDKYALAEPLYKEALQIRKELVGEKHPDYATTLNNLGKLYYETNNYALAEPLYKQALQIRKEVLGEKDADYASSLYNLGLLYHKMSKYALAEPLYKEALKIQKEVVGEKHPNYASALNNLAVLYKDMGNYALAEPLCKEALKIQKEVVGEKHLDYGKSLTNLANLYMDMRNYALAEPLYKQALQIKKEILGDKHPAYANSLNNLGGCYLDMGNYALAEPLLKEALQIYKTTLVEKNAAYANCLNNLAMVYNNLNKNDLAESLHKETLQVRKKVLGEKHPDCARSLHNLGNFYNKIGNYAMAESSLKEGLKIMKEVLGEKHPDYAGGLISLGGLYLNTEKYAAAEPLFKEALKIQKEVLGEKHPKYAISLIALGVLYVAKGEHDKAVPLYTTGLNITKHNLSQNFAWLSEKGKNAYWQREKVLFEALNNIALLTKNDLVTSSELAYQGNLLSKALLLETSRELEDAVAKSTDARTIQVYSNLKEKRHLYAHLLSSGFGKKDILNQIEHEADSLDKILVGRMGEYAASKRKFEITWKEVQAGLKEKEAAIEFARYAYGKEKETRYMALVLRPGYKHPQVVNLGSEKSIAAIPAGKGFKDLYKLIWQPIDSLLVGVETVYYSPDGYLNNIAFAALMGEGKEMDLVAADEIRGGIKTTTSKIENAVYLSSRYKLHQISTTRYLAEGLKHPKIDKSVLVFGGVNYEDMPANTNASANATNTDYALVENIARSSTSQSRMAYLPGTQTELQNLQEVLNGNKWYVRAHSDKNASENTLKSEVKKESPGVLHIATHGFAFPEIEEKKSLGLDDKKSYRDADNPMVRCGLLFAGANHSWTGDANKMLSQTGEDGILTALEVAALPLKNTKLVVLSACETGLGKIEGSEGTFGLKRGFKLAGVEQIIVSLWSVPDKETMELMSLFYEDLAKTHDAVVSFEKAQKTMREKYADRPDLWAGFVLVR